jgi:hypothetical protein
MNKMKSATHIQTQRDKSVSNKDLVMEILGYDELQYNTMLYNAGDRFLEFAFPADSKFAPMKQYHERKRLYWNWFRSEFMLLDERMLNNYFNHLDQGVRFRNVHFTWSKSIDHWLISPGLHNGFNNYLKINRKHEQNRAKTGENNA